MTCSKSITLATVLRAGLRRTMMEAGRPVRRLLRYNSILDLCLKDRTGLFMDQMRNVKQNMRSEIALQFFGINN